MAAPTRWPVVLGVVAAKATASRGPSPSGLHRVPRRTAHGAIARYPSRQVLWDAPWPAGLSWDGCHGTAEALLHSQKQEVPGGSCACAILTAQHLTVADSAFLSCMAEGATRSRDTHCGRHAGTFEREGRTAATADLCTHGPPWQTGGQALGSCWDCVQVPSVQC